MRHCPHSLSLFSVLNNKDAEEDAKLLMEKVDRIVEQLQKACKESTAYKEVKAFRIGRSYVCAQRRNQFDPQNHLTWNMKIIKHRREECKQEEMNYEWHDHNWRNNFLQLS